MTDENHAQRIVAVETRQEDHERRIVRLEDDHAAFARDLVAMQRAFLQLHNDVIHNTRITEQTQAETKANAAAIAEVKKDTADAVKATNATHFIVKGGAVVASFLGIIWLLMQIGSWMSTHSVR